MRSDRRKPTQCYIDESIHSDNGFVVTSFVFASGRFDRAVAGVLKKNGFVPGKDEVKSTARMDRNPKMRAARDSLLALAGSKVHLAVYVGPIDSWRFGRAALAKHTLQALQSTLIRNSLRPSHLSLYFDRDLFASEKEAARLFELFHYLHPCHFYPKEDSRLRLGLQVADAVANSFAQILKEHVSGKPKMVEIGGRGTGYPKGTKAPLGWHLLMTLRRGLLTRPMINNGEPYDPCADPVILDPMRDDPAVYGQTPVLMGWGVQVAPEAHNDLKIAVQKVLGTIYLGCIH